MSGGSLDYVYGRVADAADKIEAGAKQPIHRAFAAHLRLVSKALQDLEWVWSSDYSDGDECESIRAVISADAEIRAAVKDAETASENLRATIAVYAAAAALGKEVK